MATEEPTRTRVKRTRRVRKETESQPSLNQSWNLDLDGVIRSVSWAGNDLERIVTTLISMATLARKSQQRADDMIELLEEAKSLGAEPLAIWKNELPPDRIELRSLADEALALLVMLGRARSASDLDDYVKIQVLGSGFQARTGNLPWANDDAYTVRVDDETGDAPGYQNLGSTLLLALIGARALMRTLGLMIDEPAPGPGDRWTNDRTL